MYFVRAMCVIALSPKLRLVRSMHKVYFLCVHVLLTVYPNISTVPVSFVTYQDPRLFRMDTNQALDAQNFTDEYIGSHVISLTVELLNVTISKLPQNSPVIIRFSDVVMILSLKSFKTYGQYVTERNFIFNVFKCPSVCSSFLSFGVFF